MNKYKIKTTVTFYRAVGVSIDKDYNNVGEIYVVGMTKAEARDLANAKAASQGGKAVVKLYRVTTKINKILETDMSLEEISKAVGGKLRDVEKGERI